MKFRINRPKPQPLPPATITITMNEREARILEVIGRFNRTIPEMVAKDGWGKAHQITKDEVMDLLDDLQTHLENGLGN